MFIYIVNNTQIKLKNSKMTNLTESEKQKINLLIESINPNQFKGLSTKIKYLYPDIFVSIKKIQMELKLSTFSEALYLVLNDMSSVPECKHISKNCKGKLRFKNFVEGYFEYCKACSSSNEDFMEKRQETNLYKYGCIYPTQNDFIKRKIISKLTKKSSE